MKNSKNLKNKEIKFPLRTFENAQLMHKKNPRTFLVPSKKELEEIKVGDNVKVCVNSIERFWVIITKIKGNKITGEVDNDLTFIDKKLGDTISFEKKHVYDIFK